MLTCLWTDTLICAHYLLRSLVMATHLIHVVDMIIRFIYGLVLR